MWEPRCTLTKRTVRLVQGRIPVKSASGPHTPQMDATETVRTAAWMLITAVQIRPPVRDDFHPPPCFSPSSRSETVRVYWGDETRASGKWSPWFCLDMPSGSGVVSALTERPVSLGVGGRSNPCQSKQLTCRQCP